MANPEHLEILKEGVDVWNRWRGSNPDIRPNFSDEDLSGLNLAEIDFSKTNLLRANLSDSNLKDGHLAFSDLREANLVRANLAGSNMLGTLLMDSNLTEANLNGAIIIEANFHIANLNKTNFSKAVLGLISFLDVDLSNTIGLDKCIATSKSFVDHRTLSKSKNLSLNFLRIIGLPDNYIEYIPSLFHGDAIQYYSCFISYSSSNQDFAKRLHADLQNQGVRCWFAPEDMKIGAKIRHAIDSAIRLLDSHRGVEG